ncbi:MAG: bile acid:sodium symporter [Chloroflexota bacterium]|nr:bile acid:sodium symporter [Chloroflexota bacterium]
MTEIMETLSLLSMLVFVIGSMASMGLSLKVKQITASLKNIKLVILALIVNFILVPLVAYAITLVFPLDEPLRIGIILLATAAGAPFLPKLGEASKGNIAFSVGLMVLLMVVTIIYLPLVLPLLLGGVEVNPWDIAQSLIVLMLIPLALGLFINARYEETAAKLQPVLGQASNTALLMLTVLGLVLNFREMIGLVGSFGILAAVIFIVISLMIGYLLGGSDSEFKSVMGLGAAQRNISAALVVAGQNFGIDVVTYLMVVSIVGLVVLMPLAGELGKRQSLKAGNKKIDNSAAAG